MSTCIVLTVESRLKDYQFAALYLSAFIWIFYFSGNLTPHSSLGLSRKRIKENRNRNFFEEKHGVTENDKNSKGNCVTKQEFCEN